MMASLKQRLLSLCAASQPISEEYGMDEATLATAIKRDLLRERPARAKAAECFACGREYSYRHIDGDDSSRFCSAPCRESYEDGWPRYESLDTRRCYSLRMGKDGFLIHCAGCGQEFDSKGMRCCSLKCEQVYRLKQEVADRPFRAVKRKCLECGNDIPNWRKGRRVSKATRFCSDRCAANARRKRVRLLSGLPPTL